MFDFQCANDLRSSLPAFVAGEACRVSVQATAPLSDYLEHYGFYEVMKSFNGDYYLGTSAMVVAEESLNIAIHYWAHPQPRGLIMLVHGLFDHAGLYLKATRYFLEQGYSVLAPDLPGHGLSEGPQTAIDSFFDYASVVTQLLQAKPPELVGLPVYGVGQSTGAAVLMAQAFASEQADEPPPYERMVFLGPLIQPRRWRLGRLTLRLFGGFMSSVHRDMSVQNSHDEEFLNFLRRHDPLQSRRLDVRWVRALDSWVRYCPQAPIVDTPVLLVQGTADKVVNWEYNVPMIERKFSCHQVNYIEGAMHHLVNESDPYRKAIFAGVGQFLKQRAVCKA